MTARFLSGGRWRDEPLFIVPLASLGADPAFAPAANTGRLVQCDDGNRYHSDGTAWRLNLTGGSVEGVTVVRDTELFLQEFATDDLPSAALNDRRMLLNGDTDLPMIADGSAWRSLVDEARAAEIAADTLADVFRPVDSYRVIEVAPSGTEEEGVLYVGDGALGRALAYCGKFLPTYIVDWMTDSTLNFVINIKSGFTVREQIASRGTNFGHVIIVAEDASVPVSGAHLTRAYGAVSSSHILFNFEAGTAPTIACLFTADGVTPAQDLVNGPPAPYTPRTMGVRVADGASFALTHQQFNTTTVAPLDPRKIGGLDNFDFGIGITGATAVVFHAAIRNSGLVALDAGPESGVILFGLDGRGSGTNTIVCNAASVTISSDRPGEDAVVPGLYSLMLRKNPASDSDLDIAISNGGLVRNNSTGMLGGSATPRGEWQASGAFFDVRATPLARYYATAVGLPSASLWPNRFTSTGDEGPVWSNGTNWFPITIGAAL